MGPVIPGSIVVAAVVAIWWLEPYGYTLDRHDRFVSQTAWTGHVIWSEIGVGFALAVVAAICWRKGLQQIRREPVGSPA